MATHTRRMVGDGGGGGGDDGDGADDDDGDDGDVGGCPCPHFGSHVASMFSSKIHVPQSFNCVLVAVGSNCDSSFGHGMF